MLIIPLFYQRTDFSGKHGKHTKYTKICAFKILPYGIAEKVGGGLKKGMLISKSGGKFLYFHAAFSKIHDEWLFTLKGLSVILGMAAGARLVHPDLRATNTMNGTQWEQSLTLDTQHSSWHGWSGHGGKKTST